MKTLSEVLQISTQFLQDRKIDRPKRLVEDLLAHILRCKRINIYMQFDRPIVESELIVLRESLKRLAKHEPLEYIIGELEFFGCLIKTDARALIPRPETEILVDMIAKRMQGQKSLWDICTGSGCIGIALKKKFPDMAVALSDLSPEALSLAKENAEKNGVEIELCQGDLLAPFAGRTTDLIVCNPPYITPKEFLTLDSSVRDFEPKMALVGGTDFYERLSLESPNYLNPKGQLVLEIGFSQGKEIFEIFSSPIWVRRELIQDFSGKDRFFFLEKQ